MSLVTARRIRLAGVIVMILCVALVLGRTAEAQDGIRVSPGWGLEVTSPPWSDVSWYSAVPEILAAWTEYLRSDARRQRPTHYWTAAEQLRWPDNYDLTAFVAYQGFPGTVLDIQPAHVGATDEFVVRTLFGSVSSADLVIRPVAITRVFAILEDGRWVFANALPRLTADWPRTQVGGFTYISEPGRQFDVDRAEQAVAFADSVADLFGVPRLDSLIYYVSDNPEELRRVMGVDWHVRHGLPFGLASAATSQLWSAEPEFGEAHIHEIVHVVLRPLLVGGRAHGVVNEGVATWLGGSSGMSFPELMREYAAYLQVNPEVSLDVVLNPAGVDSGLRPAAAALVLLVYERGGIEEVKELFSRGREDAEFRFALTEIFGAEWTEIAELWKARILEFARDD